MGRVRRNLARARRLLKESGIRILRESSLYRTQPVGFADQPWFINQALCVESRLDPAAFLRRIKELERRMKRIPGRRYGPRSIDIDILLAGRRVISRAGLRIPHPRLARRRFVLEPLSEIAPRTVHPVLGKTAMRLLRELQDRSFVTRIHGG